MKTVIRVLSVLVVLFVATSCQTVTRPPEYTYQKEALRITLRGDSRLNLYQGSAHTLVVCTYQLRDPNGFNQLVDEKDGLSRLLECGRFDPSVAYTKRMVVQPGQEVKEALDRAEGAKYVGIVAGYYVLQKTSAVRLYQIPVGTLSAKPRDMEIEIYLGPQALQDIRGK